MLGFHHTVQPMLRRGIVLQHRRDRGVRLYDLDVAARDLLGGLRVVRRLLRYRSASGERLTPLIDALLLLVGSLDTT